MTTTEQETAVELAAASFDAGELRKALTGLKTQVPVRRVALAELGMVHISADGSSARLTVTDIDITASVTVPAGGDVATFLVDRKALLESIKGAKGPVSLTTAGGDFASVGVTTAAGISTSLTGGQWQQWGKIGTDPAGKCESLDTYRLGADVLAQVTIAAATDDVRPMLACVHLEGSEMVATDSYRLHVATVPGATYPKVNIPARALVGMAKVGDVTFRLGTGPANAPMIYAESGAWRWAVRLYDGDYPNYSQLIPQGAAPVVATFNRSALTSTLKALPKCDRTVPVRFTFEDGAWTVSIKSNYDGPATSAKVPGDVTGEAFQWGAAPDYFADCVSVGTDPETVTVHLTDALKPMTFRDGPLRLLMPVRL